MKKLFIYGLLALSPVALVSCSDDEELLEPSADYVDNKFAVPDDATGPEADLRRQFYKDNGVYLLFNDLLSRDYKGVDEFGQEIWQEERVDFVYDLTSYGTDEPIFEFIESQDEKEKAAEMIEAYLLPRIEGGKLAPFSIMPVKNLQTYRYENYEYDYYDALTVSCWRCLAVATGEWAEAEGEERDALTAAILKDLVSSKFTYRSDAAKEFYDISIEISGEYLDEIYDDWEDDPDITRVYELGFLSYKSGWYGDYLPYTEDDFDSYVDCVLGMDESEFMEQYGDYANIVTKYNIIKDALIGLGLKF